MRVIRMLVYEGDERFIATSLANRSVVGVKGSPNNSTSNTITEYYLQSPLPIYRDPPDIFKPITKEKKLPHDIKTKPIGT